VGNIIKYVNNTFNINFILACGVEERRFRDMMWSEYGWSPDNVSASVSGFTTEIHNPSTGAHAIIVWSRVGEGADVVAHEMLHAVNKGLLSRGYVPEAKNDEVQCYMLSELMRQVYPPHQPKKSKRSK